MFDTEQLLKKGDYRIIRKGVTTAYAVTFCNRTVFHKHRCQHLYYKFPFNKLTLFLVDLIRSAVPMLSFKNKTMSKESYIQKENKTIELWRKMGISVPEVLRVSGSSITYRFLHDILSFRFLLENGLADDDLFMQLIALHNKLRQSALTTNNSDIFHSDCHLENYAYDTETGTILPIDPAAVLNSTVPIEVIDQGLNLYFLYSINSIDLPKNKIFRYSRLFLDTLDSETIKAMKKMNTVSFSYRFIRCCINFFKSIFCIYENEQTLLTKKNQERINELLTV